MSVHHTTGRGAEGPLDLPDDDRGTQSQRGYQARRGAAQHDPATPESRWVTNPPARPPRIPSMPPAKPRMSLRRGIYLGAFAVVLAVAILFVAVLERGASQTTSANSVPTAGVTAAANPTAKATKTTAPVVAGGPVTCTYSPVNELTGVPAALPLGDNVATTGTINGTINVIPDRKTNEVVPIKITLNHNWPCSERSFATLADSPKFYDGTNCHRLTTKEIFLLQCGTNYNGPDTDAASSGAGYRFLDTPQTAPTKGPNGYHYPAGSVVLSPYVEADGSTVYGSQFYIVYSDTDLGQSYPVIGQVTSGLEVITGVAAQGSDNSYGDGDGRPKNPLFIDSIRVG